MLKRLGWLKKTIDSCISQEIKDESSLRELYKVRFLVMVGALFTVISLASFLTQFYVSGVVKPTMVVPFITIFTSLSLIAQVKYLKSNTSALWSLQIFFLILLPIAVIQNKTILSPPVFFLPVLPMLFAVLGDLKRGFIIAGLCFVASIFGLSLFPDNPYTDTNHFHAKSISGLISVVTATLTIFGLTYVSNLISHLVEKDLKKQAKKSAESEQMKTQFLANVSHEIRTPLNNVIGHSELLRDRLAIHEFSHFHLENIFRSSRQLTDIISNVIEASRIDINAYEFTPSDVDVAKTVYEYGNLYFQQAEAKGLNIVFDMSDVFRHNNATLPKEAFGKIIYHLLSNATKFTASGEIKVDIDFDTESSRLNLTVNDSGIGINDEKMAFIFDKFLQGNEEMTREFGGLGLGLAITKAIVDSIGGRIKVTSTLGSGTSFSVDFPAQLEPRSEDNTTELLTIHVVDPTLLIAEYVRAESCRLPFACESYRHAMAIEPHTIADSDVVIVHNSTGEANLSASINTVAKVAGKAAILVHGNELNQLGSGTDDRYILLNHLEDFPKFLPDFNRVESQPNAHSELSELSENPEPTEQQRILIVDDAEDNRTLMKIYLEASGFATALAEDGVEAVDAAMNNRFDLILMDIQMPNMDGFEATDKINEWEERFVDRQKTPIIIVTAHDIEEHRDQCKKLNTAGFITKPLRKKAFVKEIKAVLNTCNSTRGAA